MAREFKEQALSADQTGDRPCRSPLSRLGLACRRLYEHGFLAYFGIETFDDEVSAESGQDNNTGEFVYKGSSQKIINQMTWRIGLIKIRGMKEDREIQRRDGSMSERLVGEAKHRQEAIEEGVRGYMAISDLQEDPRGYLEECAGVYREKAQMQLDRFNKKGRDNDQRGYITNLRVAQRLKEETEKRYPATK